MKIALLTTRLFDAPGSGGEICTARLMRHLRELGCDLVVAGRGALPDAAPRTAFTSLGPRVEALSDQPLSARLRSLAGALCLGRAWTAHRTQAGGAWQRARDWLSSPAVRNADALIVDHLHPWAWLPAQRPAMPTLLLMHNVESQAYRPEDAASRGQRWVLAREARLLDALERKALQRADAVLCLSDGDAMQARQLGARSAHVAVLPGHADGANKAPAARTGSARRIGLIGTWSWPANRRALDWMLNRVVPHLPADCQVVLAGQGLECIDVPARVLRLGRVDAVQDFYAQVDVLAIAALDGSGVQEKAIEALATGLPIVATPHAVRGLQPLPPGVCVADGPEAFAAACASAQGDASMSHRRQWHLQRRRQYRQTLDGLLRGLCNARTAALQLSTAR